MKPNETFGGKRKRAPPVQSFQDHKTIFISQHHTDVELFEKWRHLSCTLRPPKRYPRLNSTPEQTLLCHDSVVCVVHLKRACIQHADVGFGLFFAQYFAEGETIGYFYGSLVYSDAIVLFDRYKTYAEVELVVAGFFFKRYAYRLHVEVAGSRGRAHNVWIFAVNICCL